MKRLLDFLRKHKIVIVVSACLVGIIGFTTFTYLLPFKSYGDIWAHFAVVEELKKPFDQLGDPYFNQGVIDPHSGPYLVVVAAISNVTGVNFIIVMQILGLLSVVLVYLMLIKAYHTFLPHRAKFQIDNVILAMVVFLGWESSRISFAGYYSLADIAITALFPHMFAMAAFLYGVVQMVKLLDLEVENPKPNKVIGLALAKIILIGTFIILTHTITGVVFFYTFGVFTGYYALFKFRRLINIYLFINLAAVILSFALCVMWPYYNIFTLLADGNVVHVDQPLVSIFEAGNWIQVAGIAFLGIIPAMRTKNKLLVFWWFAVLFILLSYLYPIRTSSYWRFFPVFLMPLYFMLTEWVSDFNNVVRTFVVSLFLVFGFSSFVNKVNTIGYRAPVDPSIFSFVQAVPENELILSDPDTSYLFAGVTGNAVLAVDLTHWNPSNQKVTTERYQDALLFWSEANPATAKYVIDKYDAEYILVNKRAFPDFPDLIAAVGKSYSISQLHNDDRFLLIQVNK